MNALALVLMLVAAKHKPPAPAVVARPFHADDYAITLELDAQSGAFTSTTAMTLTPTAATSTIALDVQDLTVKSVKLGEADAKFEVKPTENGKQELVITLGSEAAAGKPLTLTLVALGTATPNGSLGLISSKDPAHEGRTIFYSMFEPGGARRVFPCDDTPGDKATSSVSVLTDASLQVIGNGEKASDDKVEGDNKKHKVTWKLTKPQSTYLIAFAVGAFESTPVEGAPVPAAFWTASGEGAHLKFPGQLTSALLASEADFVGTPFPWPRYDQVAIPEFVWHGMENTSATFLRASMLESPDDALADRNRLTSLMGHELAHQWFGDDVTPAKWSEVWLNEAFATYVERVVVTDFEKSDSAFIDATLKNRDEYFRFEDGPRARPLVSDAATDEDSFDAAAYLKGASILRMLETYVGREAFKRALKSYLAAHAYGTASSDDFIAAVSSASGKDLSAFNKSWLHETGYPTLKVSRRWLAGEKQVALSIEEKSSKGKKIVWPAKLIVVAHRTAEPSYNLNVPIDLQATQTIGVPLPDEPEWIDWNEGDAVLAKIESNDKVDNLAAESLKDRDPMARLWADLELAGALADPEKKPQTAPPEGNLEALAAAIKKDHSPYVRAAVLHELSRGTFKKLPAALSSVVLEQAIGPQGLADDPLGAAELKRAAYSLLGRVDDPATTGILNKPMKDATASLDLIQGAALGLGHKGDTGSLGSALKTQSPRGALYVKAVLAGYCAVEDGSVAPQILEQAAAHKDSPDMQQAMIDSLGDNVTLLRSTPGTHLVAQIAGDGRFDIEQRVRWMNLLDDVHTPAAKTELTTLSKSTNVRIAAVAKQKLRGGK